MAVRDERKLGIGVSVYPELDQRKVASVIRDVTSLHKKLGPIKMDWTEIAKKSQVSVSHIKEMSSAASVFTRKLSSAASQSFKELSSLGKELEEATNKAAALKAAYSKEKNKSVKESMDEDLAAAAAHIADLNQKIEEHQKVNHKYGSEMKGVIKAQKEYQSTLQDAAKFGPRDMMKGLGGGLMKALSGGREGFKAGIADAFSSAGKGAIGGIARKQESNAAAVGGTEGAAMLAKSGAAITALTAAVAGIAALVKFIMAASSHMTDLNKALLKGSTLAGDAGKTAIQYSSALKGLRDSAIRTHGSMLKLGGDSEKSLSIVSAFSNQASGSIVKTAAQLEMMGDGVLDSGLNEFAKNAIVYGKALGIEAEEVGGIMGQFVSEVGVGAENVQKVMGDIAKQAATSNMPVHKFMDIFRQTVPNVDLFTNRIEELTGVVKLLSKAMSAKDVKGFMDAFSRGFDQLDFRQRLKMALVVGPGKVSKVLEKDFKRAGSNIVNQFGSLGPELADALSGKKGDIVNAVRDVSAKAMASGNVEPAAIAAAQKLARAERLRKQGGPLAMAGAMRGAGVMARMDLLQEHAGKLTGGNIEGLGEHVAKQLGVSEQEYKAILQLQDAMGNYQSQIKKAGRTSSVSINSGLKKLLKQDGKLADDSEESFEAAMKKLDPATATDYIKQAAAEQIESQKDTKESMEDLTTEQINATLSIGDKIENVIGFLLEKLYHVMDDVLQVLNDVWNWVTGNESGKATNKMLADSVKLYQKTYSADRDGLNYMRDMSDKLKALNDSGANTQTIMTKMVPEINKISNLSNDEIRNNMEKFLGKDKTDEIIAAKEKGGGQAYIEKLSGALKDLDPKVLINMMAQLGTNFAEKGMIGNFKGSDKLGRGDVQSATKKTAKQISEDAKNSDLDQRTQQLMMAGSPQSGVVNLDNVEISGDPVIKAGPVKPGAGAPGVPPGGDPNKHNPAMATNEAADKITDVQKDASNQALAKQDDIYSGIDSVLGVLKKGIKFEQSWMSTKYKGVLKEATLESFRQSLLEFAIIEAKMKEDAAFSKNLTSMSGDVLSSGVGLKELSSVTDEESFKKLVQGSKLSGGPIPDTGLYKLHRGEYVVPAMTPQSNNGGNQRSVIVNQVINGAEMTPQQLRGAVFNAMDEVMRRH